MHQRCTYNCPPRLIEFVVSVVVLLLMLLLMILVLSMARTASDVVGEPNSQHISVEFPKSQNHFGPGSHFPIGSGESEPEICQMGPESNGPDEIPTQC